MLRNQVDKKGAETAGIMKPQLLAGDPSAAPVRSTVAPGKGGARRKGVAAVAMTNKKMAKETVEVIKGVTKGSVDL